jgi:hypothetical protein
MVILTKQEPAEHFAHAVGVSVNWCCGQQLIRNCPRLELWALSHGAMAASLGPGWDSRFLWSHGAMAFLSHRMGPHPDSVGSFSSPVGRSGTAGFEGARHPGPLIVVHDGRTLQVQEESN